MNKIIIIVLILLSTTFALSPNAIAGPYGDDMARCLVEATTDAEKYQLVKWMFTAVSAHPALSSISSVTYTDREGTNKITAEIFMKLLTDTCKEKTMKAVKYEGAQSISIGFEVLGKVAAHGLFSDPSVAKEVSALGNYFDKNKLKEIGLNQ